MKIISKEQIDALQRYDLDNHYDSYWMGLEKEGDWVKYDDLRAIYDNAPSVVCNKETAITELWECIGRWSAYLIANGEQADLSPPQWLMDAVKNATTPQPDRVALPSSVEEAVAMEQIGYAYLKQHAPDRLADRVAELLESATIHEAPDGFEMQPAGLVAELEAKLKEYEADAKR